MKKKYLFLTCLLIFSMIGTVCFAEKTWLDDNYDTTEVINEDGKVINGAGGNTTNAGTEITIKQNGESISIILDADECYGPLRGYNASGWPEFGSSYPSNEDGKHEYTVDDIKDTLNTRANDPTLSAEEREQAQRFLDNLNNETNTFWTDEPTLTIGGETKTAIEWEKTFSEIYGDDWQSDWWSLVDADGNKLCTDSDNLLWSVRSLLAALETVTDVDELGKIVYGLGLMGITFTNTPSIPSVTITPSVTPSTTPSVTPSVTPSITPSVTPTPVPTKVPSVTQKPSPTPPKKEGEEYVLQYAGQRNCYTDDISTKVSIDDTIGDFNVKGGNPIPTSEALKLVGDTNYIANLLNIQNWQLYVVNPKPKTYTAKYHAGYTKKTVTKTVTTNDDGSTTTSTSNSSTTVTKAESDSTTTSTSGNTTTTTTVTYTEIVKDLSMAVTEKGLDALKGATVPYYYIGKSYIESDSYIELYNEAVGGEKRVDLDPASVTLDNTTNCKGAPDDKAVRSKVTNSYYIGKFDSLEKANEALKKKADSPNVKDFYAVNTDGAVYVTYGGTQRSQNCNTQLTTNFFSKGRIPIDKKLIDKIPLIPNRSNGSIYPTEWALHMVGSKYIYLIVNGVRVHTPIHDTITLETNSTNQLENGSLKPTSYKIVKLDDEFKVKIKILGGSAYYSKISYVTNKRIMDYATQVLLTCECCGLKDFDITTDIKGNNSYGPAGEYNHSCKADINKVTDLKSYKVTSTVFVENYGTGGADQTTATVTNQPDSVYVLNNNVGVFVVGKIYDLEVRAVNDASWKLKQAEKLSNLPTGEQGDNYVAAYKNGLKLGYRAYFDLKTLGTASKKVKLEPNIYYVGTNGNFVGKVGDNINLWYQTKDLKYHKLSVDDIAINMIMNNTKGSDYNTDASGKDLFKEEIAKKLIKDNSLNLNKEISIGGLLGITLDSINSTVTRYFKTNNYTTPEENCRRWYGEVYLPSSTIVANSSVSELDVANKRNVYTNGYLIVTFKPIDTTAVVKNTEVKYLEYSEIRDFNWKTPSDSGFAGNTNKSVLIEEKGSKSSIVLPNGKVVNGSSLTSGFYSEDAPIVIYDVSLRANSDREQTSTH